MMAAPYPERSVSAAGRLRRLGRWLELRAFGLIPEHFHPMDGIRAAFITAVPLGLSVITDKRELGWAIFAAFWTCLVENGGPERVRRRSLAGFVVLGAITTFLASSTAALHFGAALATGPLLVTMIALLPLRLPGSSFLATLLGVVAVVAAGYPRPPGEALLLAASFFCGGAWAAFILLLVWRLDRWLPAKQAVAAVYARIHDMALDLQQDHVAAEHIGRVQHRRSVRKAIENARTRLAQAEGDDGADTNRLRLELVAADEVFHALLAIEHLRSGLDPGLEQAITAIAPLLDAAGRDLVRPTDSPSQTAQMAIRLADLAGSRPGAAAAAVRAIAAAFRFVDADMDPSRAIWSPAEFPSPQNRRIVQAAVRSGIGVAIVTLFAHWLMLGYAYWAAMAVVVILSPARQTSWSRAIERMLGSVVGGILALALLSLISSSWPLVLLIVVMTAVTIAVRSVNYTVFVVFLTLLFVLTMEILHPGGGIAVARMTDNVLGSLGATTATLLVWPDRRPSTTALADAALAANRAYLNAVRSGDAARIGAARRAAGLASTEAEIALHAPDRILEAAPTEADFITLMAARRAAGEAAVLWYARQAAPKPV